MDDDPKVPKGESSKEEKKSKNDLSMAIPKKRKRPSLENDEDSSSDDSEASVVEVSLNQLKRQVLGRDLVVEDDEKEEDKELLQVRALMNHHPPNVGIDPEKLRKDLLCAICHEVVYPPVALACGHSFCQSCIEWWMDHDDQRRCPTCRQSVPQGSSRPNLALRACVMGLFGTEIIEKIQNKQKQAKRLTKGEDGGAHSRGYEVLSELQDETWHYLDALKVRRNIVLDAEDQRMQLAMGIYQKPTTDENRFGLELCMLHMEEDEASESGFPVHIVSHEDECLLTSRFQYSSLDVQMRQEDGGLSPLARVGAEDHGRFHYVLDPTATCTEGIRGLVFEHPETGTQLEVDLAKLQQRAGGAILLPPRDNPTLPVGFSDEEEEEEEEEERDPWDLSDYDPYEGKCAGCGTFIEDGYMRCEDCSRAIGGSSYDESDAECCCICEDGGELMVCDGGDNHPGCGKNFHASCVDRSVIPDGDWICQACAKKGGIDAGIAGHEFSDKTEEESEIEGTFSETKDAETTAPKDEEPNDEETQVVRRASDGTKHKRRLVLDDSDSE